MMKFAALTVFIALCGLLQNCVSAAARPVRYTLPRFLDTPNNITAVVGSDVMLPCSVQNLGTKSVTWKKVTKVSPITIGDYIFDPDTRYDILRTDNFMTPTQYEDFQRGEENPRWNLEIKEVGMTDAGVYKCEISTKVAIIRIVTLHVVGATTFPRFVNSSSIVITATAGSTTELPCALHDLGSDLVGWVKHGNVNPFTIGSFMWSPDTRYRLHLDTTPQDQELIQQGDVITRWNLQIQSVQMSDADIYVCQVYPGNQTLQREVTLRVTDNPTTTMQEWPDRGGIWGTTFVEYGGTLELTCFIPFRQGDYRVSPRPWVQWFKAGQRVVPNNQTSIEQRLQTVEEGSRYIFYSVLRVSPATVEDGGRYVCRVVQDLQVFSARVRILFADSSNDRRDSASNDTVA